MKIGIVAKKNDIKIKITHWFHQQLSTLGYRINSTSIEEVLNTPWSYILRITTSQGYVYLKHTPNELGLEAKIIQLLHQQFNAFVPKIIAYSQQLNCFLMKDAGQSLRSILKKQFDLKLFCKMVDQFTALQLTTAENVVSLLNIGVPDWRLTKLPLLFQELISQKDLLIKDGLSEAEIKQIITWFPMITDLCKKLSNYSIKETMVQPDFNDNNTLVDNVSKIMTTIDLGEIVITHPFFSLINCLKQVNKHYAFTAEDATYVQIKEACLKNFMKLHTRQHLSEAFKVAEQVWNVYDALAQYRLIKACGKEKILVFRPGRLTNSLKALIKP